MSNLTMWFGTRGYMKFVPCPLVDSDMSKVGWNAAAQYLNGGTSIRSSVAAHKVYNLAWGLQDRDNIRLISDYADGVYGDELIYFIDPFAQDKNVLPQYWAVPSLAFEDAPILVGTAKPFIVETDSNIYGYPRNSAVYFVSPTEQRKNIYIPIPEGYTAHVGVHGSRPDGSTAHVRMRGAVGSTGFISLSPASGSFAEDELPLLGINTDERVNVFQPNADGIHGIVLDFQGTGTLILSGIIVQILKDGVVPETGGFISGQGHSGCKFATQPTLQNYSSAMDKSALTAVLVEVGAWA
jgi:hypothetical protein